MKRKIFRKCISLLLLIVFVSSGIQANAYLTEEGTEAEMIRIERVISSNESLVGKVETITYNLTGDTILYDPPKEIALVVDVSGSMNWTVDGKSTSIESKRRISILKNAAKNFVARWQNRNTSICIVPFSYYVTAEPELVSMKDADCLSRLDSIIDALSAGGNTNIGDGMRVAYHTLNNSSNTGASKYVITLTDGEPNLYSCVSTYEKDKYFKDQGIITLNRAIYNVSKAFQYATDEIGKMIFNNDKFRSFVIGFATPDNLKDNLNQIGLSSGAKMLANGNYFYYAGSQQELDQAYTDISNIIADDVPFSSALFSEVLPEGTIIDDAAKPQLIQEGYDINDSYVDPNDPEHEIRTRITKSLSGSIALARKYPDATTSPQNLVYQLRPYSFTISIEYTTPGTKIFKKEDCKINYDDPFMNKAYTAYCSETVFVSVTQPVTGLENKHTIVMVNQEGGPGIVSANVLPNDPPNVAENMNIKSWKIVSAVDVNNEPAGLGEIVETSAPVPADPLNGILEVKGLKPGKAYIEAETEGTDLDGNTIKGTSVVFAVDAAVASVSMNKGDIKDLNESTRKYVPETNTAEVDAKYLTFSGWRLEDSADAEFVTVEPSGIVKANKPLEHDIKVLVDVNYTVGTAGSSSYFNVHKTISASIVVAQPVTDLEINSAIVMAGSSEQMKAVVKPDDAYNRNIKTWRLLDENGNDVTSTSEIAALAVVSDPFNSIREAAGKKGGTVIVDAETEGFDGLGERIRKQAKIYVLDAACEDEITIKLWRSYKIEPVAYVPDDLLGEIKFTFASSDTASVPINNIGEIEGLKLTGDTPVVITITAEYYDASGQPTGKVKVMTCNVEVEKPDIDIN